MPREVNPGKKWVKRTESGRIGGKFPGGGAGSGQEPRWGKAWEPGKGKGQGVPRAGGLMGNSQECSSWDIMTKGAVTAQGTEKHGAVMVGSLGAMRIPGISPITAPSRPWDSWPRMGTP